MIRECRTHMSRTPKICLACNTMFVGREYYRESNGEINCLDCKKQMERE